MDVLVRANEKGFREMKQMCEALLELMEDELKEKKEEGRQEQLQLLISKKIAKGKSLEQIADELEETIEVISPLYQKVLVEQ